MKLLFLVPALAILLLVKSNSYSQTDKRYSRETEENIKKVESNLSPPVKIEGEGEWPWTIQERMEHYNVNAVSIAVIHNYKIVWAKAYGWADKTLMISATPQTLFQAGSISKSLNALGVLKLVQDKKLDLYGDINDYLHSWKFPYDQVSKGKKITMANLLSHTAGLNVSGFSGYQRGKDIPSVVQILNGEKPANSEAVRSITEPGLNYEYSGGGTTISQLILMDITDQPYDQYMDQHILKSLGMANSTFTQPPTAIDSRLLSVAYDQKGNAVPGNYHVYPEQAAAGLWSNPTDLGKFIIETQLAYMGRSNKVLSQQLTQLELTSYLNDHSALGVFIDNYTGVKYFEHDGVDLGFSSQYYGSLNGGNGLVVMINSNNDRLIPEIVNSIAEVYQFEGLYRTAKKQIVIDDGTLQSYSGSYRLTPELVLTVAPKDNYLSITTSEGDVLKVYPETNNTFFSKDLDAVFEFVKGLDGKSNRVILHQDGANVEGEKLK